LQRYIFF